MTSQKCVAKKYFDKKKNNLAFLESDIGGLKNQGAVKTKIARPKNASQTLVLVVIQKIILY